MKEMSEKEMLLDRISTINSKTKYELIEIEQVSSRFNGATGLKDIRYKKILDDSDPGHVTVKELKGIEFYGSELRFYENPYSRKPLSGTTGKVAFILADNELVPVNSQSGEKTGWNLEFLASHYGLGLFKIVDPKWDDKVRSRYEKILSAQETKPPVHKFDRRYEVKGIGVQPEPGTMKIQVDHSGQEEIKNSLAEMQKKIDDLIEENNRLSSGKKKPGSKKEVKHEGITEVNASNFAG